MGADGGDEKQPRSLQGPIGRSCEASLWPGPGKRTPNCSNERTPVSPKQYGIRLSDEMMQLVAEIQDHLKRIQQPIPLPPS